MAIAFTVSVDHKSTSTGISAFERSLTILELLNEDSVAEDFQRPGHTFPIVAKRRRRIKKGRTYGGIGGLGEVSVVPLQPVSFRDHE